MTKLSVKFDDLTKQISKLLELFEISAKALVEKDFGLEKENKDVKKIMEKIDNLLNQNKIIARGVSLLHESQNSFETPSTQKPPQTQQQISPPNPTGSKQSIDVGKYQKSISSRYPRLPRPE